MPVYLLGCSADSLCCHSHTLLQPSNTQSASHCLVYSYSLRNFLSNTQGSARICGLEAADRTRNTLTNRKAVFRIQEDLSNALVIYVDLEMKIFVNIGGKKVKENCRMSNLVFCRKIFLDQTDRQTN